MLTIADDPLVTPEELAAELRIVVATIYVWRTRSKGPSGFRVGRHLRYRRSEIDRWLTSLGDTRTHTDNRP
jgi:predicted DNA-binding transcriptional regulator AlpA